MINRALFQFYNLYMYIYYTYIYTYIGCSEIRIKVLYSKKDLEKLS